MCFFQRAFLLLCQYIWHCLAATTGLSEREMQALRNLPSMQIRLTVCTVVAKGMLGLPVDVGNKREHWTAMDDMVSQDVDWFVGNSISTLSALTMEVRARQKMPVLPYNGGVMSVAFSRRP